MQTPAPGAKGTDPWLLRQICDELDAMKEAGEDVPEAAYTIAEDMGQLVEEGVSPHILAEHAAELARRLKS
jgi:hypothetical protein